ncbi:TlpA disulfide reductase family protein [Cupriavidus sp. WKF15]|uniref:TlpA disulfide reductase family protein n=1 Tax=Cupriavidus sp. WKF15 TaxID=3032282 RepID=UPI0023E132B6|nr:TlpA disulfide reductase family protein [Cupriavidus sp. WKF15]WER49927.1 TlpA disulfide reductase family protein [Cupriavidus sp. WKF15]
MLSPTAIVVLAALLLGETIAFWLGRRSKVDIDKSVITIVVAGAISARLAFVWKWHTAYLAAPLSILDIRDGGWSLTAGLVVGCVLVLWIGLRNATLRKPLAAAMLASFSVLGIGSVVVDRLDSAKLAQGRLPELPLASLQGEAVVLSSFAGRPTVLNLWASWCPPCRQEMPMLRAAQANHSDINFVFVNQGETAHQVRRYLTEQHLTMSNLLLDPQSHTAAALGQIAFPTTYLFDATGRLIDVRVGELSAGTLAERLARLIAQDGKASAGQASRTHD